MKTRISLLGAVAAWTFASACGAHEIASKPNAATNPSFDIVKTDVRIDRAKGWVEFTMQVSGKAGAAKPKATGKFAGAQVFSYVWPTKIDPSEVGFERAAGI